MGGLVARGCRANGFTTAYHADFHPPLHSSLPTRHMYIFRSIDTKIHKRETDKRCVSLACGDTSEISTGSVFADVEAFFRGTCLSLFVAPFCEIAARRAPGEVRLGSPPSVIEDILSISPFRTSHDALNTRIHAISDQKGPVCKNRNINQRLF